MGLKKIYYHLTAYVPRKLPATEAEFLAFKDIMLKYYGLKDEPDTYAMMTGQIQSTPGHKIRKSYGHIANSVKRLGINGLAKCYRVAAQQEAEARAMKALEAQVEAYKKDQESKTSIQGSIDGEAVSEPGVQATAGPVVQQA